MNRYPPRSARKAPANSAASPPGLPARRAALRLLDAVVRRGDPLELALHGATQGLRERADRALVHAIVADVLRHMHDLDALIDGATPERLPDDAKARMVLRIALVQHLLLGTPPHAVVATALPLVDGGPRRLVHGVLGHLIREEAKLPDAPTLPADVAARWSEAWGADVARAASILLGGRAPLDLSLRDVAATADWAARLNGVSLMPGHVRIGHDAHIPDLPGFAEGAWWVQDMAASLPARLAGAGGGRHALDLCAAPGGKTMQLAAQGWAVTALDKSAKRLERLHENMARSGLAAQVVAADAMAWRPDAPADLVLLDAPCSATGIFRRHPDVLHRVGARQIAEMMEMQTRLIDHAADMVAPGGMLIYATCSLEPGEGEEQIAGFLSRHPHFHPVPVQPGELPDGLNECAPGQIRVVPGALADKGGLDGFYIARLRRE